MRISYFYSTYINFLITHMFFISYPLPAIIAGDLLYKENPTLINAGFYKAFNYQKYSKIIFIYFLSAITCEEISNPRESFIFI